ncbi:hypothetical protein KP509_25G041600 [Ceratopteris richardii]|uniref:Uncharacterized protein n=1 Tax=Ceratopteris richardii TaxID=49495 RepID=A0A8T2RPI5_CERRI|nr:hypothetical protein KP509_25G041600 [Ceratopteris richardii]
MASAILMKMVRLVLANAILMLLLCSALRRSKQLHNHDAAGSARSSSGENEGYISTITITTGNYSDVFDDDEHQQHYNHEVHVEGEDEAISGEEQLSTDGSKTAFPETTSLEIARNEEKEFQFVFSGSSMANSAHNLEQSGTAIDADHYHHIDENHNDKSTETIIDKQKLPSDGNNVGFPETGRVESAMNEAEGSRSSCFGTCMDKWLHQRLWPGTAMDDLTDEEAYNVFSQFVARKWAVIRGDCDSVWPYDSKE